MYQTLWGVGIDEKLAARNAHKPSKAHTMYPRGLGQTSMAETSCSIPVCKRRPHLTDPLQGYELSCSQTSGINNGVSKFSGFTELRTVRSNLALVPKDIRRILCMQLCASIAGHCVRSQRWKALSPKLSGLHCRGVPATWDDLPQGAKRVSAAASSALAVAALVSSRFLAASRSSSRASRPRLESASLCVCAHVCNDMLASVARSF